ncbi:MAG TPA: iron ABC transporter permease [Sutterella wadsworthensis]|nr:iron ABC transporter permease [Sutterella wadsworthensis]HCG93143.1 iron ABC transporter permease [Sutterella wadsworthensis]
MTRSTCILLVLLTLMSVLSLFVGAADITPADVLSGDIESLELMLISRLPRLLAILCTGMGMSIAGLIMQQLCANKFVSPTTGATISSAQFGILIALLFFPDSTLWSRALFAFAAAILGTWTFVWFILRMPMKDPVMVPLVGIMFGNVIGGVTNFLAYRFDMTQALSTWLVGHFSLVLRGNFELVYLVLPLIVLAWIFAKHFNIVGMGRDFSKNLGVNYTLVLFSGLIVPNLIAIFKGDDLRSTLADTALFGALFVLCCDVIGRLVIAPYELPIELIIGTIGSLLFIALIFYRLRFGRMSLDKKQLLRLFGLDRRTPACGGAK